MDMPEIIGKRASSGKSDMPAIIFFRFLQYYDSNERVEELLESRKNLVEMLKKLQTNLSEVSK